jgi:hypothetical protein
MAQYDLIDLATERLADPIKSRAVCWPLGCQPDSLTCCSRLNPFMPSFNRTSMTDLPMWHRDGGGMSSFLHEVTLAPTFLFLPLPLDSIAASLPYH